MSQAPDMCHCAAQTTAHPVGQTPCLWLPQDEHARWHSRFDDTYALIARLQSDHASEVERVTREFNEAVARITRQLDEAYALIAKGPNAPASARPLCCDHHVCTEERKELTRLRWVERKVTEAADGWYAQEKQERAEHNVPVAYVFRECRIAVESILAASRDDSEVIQPPEPV